MTNDEVVGSVIADIHRVTRNPRSLARVFAAARAVGGMFEAEGVSGAEALIVVQALIGIAARGAGRDPVVVAMALAQHMADARAGLCDHGPHGHGGDA